MAPAIVVSLRRICSYVRQNVDLKGHVEPIGTTRNRSYVRQNVDLKAKSKSKGPLSGESSYVRKSYNCAHLT